MRRSVMIGLGLLTGVAGGSVWWRQHQAAAPPPASAATESQTEARRGGHNGDKRPTPVVTTMVRRKDVPITLEGLGTVQAYNTVTIRSRVDGELIEVAVREGQDVRAGDVLARLDARTFQTQLDQALATRSRDEAQLELARLDLQRYLSLGNRVPGQTVDQARATGRQLEAAVRADQAAIDAARIMLGYTTIVSPIDGRTGLRLVDRGNIVHANDPGGLVVVTQVQPIAAVFTLPQQNLPAITSRLTEQGKLAVEVFDSDGGKSVDRGELTLVDNQIDQSTGTIKLKAVFPNAERRLWPGGFVTVRLLLTTRRAALVVPAPTVQRGPQGAYVFVVRADRTVEMRPVVVGPMAGDDTLIENGLADGEVVVIDGMARLQAGARVVSVREGGEAKSGGTPEGGQPEGLKPVETGSVGTKPDGKRPEGGRRRDREAPPAGGNGAGATGPTP